MFKSGRWRSEKNKVKAEFKLQFHVTKVCLRLLIFVLFFFFYDFAFGLDIDLDFGSFFSGVQLHIAGFRLSLCYGVWSIT